MVTLTREFVRAAFEEAEQARQYFDSHLEELRRQYPDQFVAVWHGEVVAAAPRLEAVRTAIAERGLDPARVAHRFIPAQPRAYIL